MTAGPLPVLRPGMTLKNMSASEFNAAMDILRAVSNFKVGPGLELDYTPGVQMSVKLSHVPPSIVSQEITVILREAPAEGATTMEVFEVAYASIPPVPCLTEEQENCGARIIERPLVAYPDFGLKPDDFKGLLTTDIKEGTFLKAYFREGTWRVKLPGAGGILGVCKILSVPNDFTATVQPLKPGPAAGDEFIDDGEPITVELWPDRQTETGKESYEKFIDKDDAFPMMQMYGGVFVYHKVRFFPKALPAGATIGGCGANGA